MFLLLTLFSCALGLNPMKIAIISGYGSLSPDMQVKFEFSIKFEPELTPILPLIMLDLSSDGVRRGRVAVDYFLTLRGLNKTVSNFQFQILHKNFRRIGPPYSPGYGSFKFSPVRRGRVAVAKTLTLRGVYLTT